MDLPRARPGASAGDRPACPPIDSARLKSLLRAAGVALLESNGLPTLYHEASPLSVTLVSPPVAPVPPVPPVPQSPLLHHYCGTGGAGAPLLRHRRHGWRTSGKCILGDQRRSQFSFELDLKPALLRLLQKVNGHRSSETCFAPGLGSEDLNEQLLGFFLSRP